MDGTAIGYNTANGNAEVTGKLYKTGDRRVSFSSVGVSDYDRTLLQLQGDKNFSQRMLEDATRRGQRDMYLGLVLANQGKTFDNAFYDNLAYNYMDNFLKLSLVNQDDTDETRRMRTKQVFNQNTNQYENKDIGVMTDRAYLNYQLAQKTQQTEARIQRDLDILHWEGMNGISRFSHTALSGAGELAEGLVGGIAKTIDGVIEFAMFYHPEDAVDYAKYYGLTKRHNEGMRASLTNWERRNSYFVDIDGNITNWGKYIGGTLNSIGNMLPSIALTAATGGAYAGIAGTIQMGFSIFGNNMYENAINANGSPAWMQYGNAFAKAVVESALEVGVSKGLQAVAGVASPVDIVRGFAGKSSVKAVADLAKIKAGSVSWAAFGNLVGGFFSEGLEEVSQDAANEFIDHVCETWYGALADYAYDQAYRGFGEGNGLTWEGLRDSFLIGGIVSVGMGGFNVAKDSISSNVIDAQNNSLKRKINALQEKGDEASLAKAEKLSGKIKNNGRMYIKQDGVAREVKGLNKMYAKELLSNAFEYLKKIEKDIKKANSKEDFKDPKFLTCLQSLRTLAGLFSTMSDERIDNAVKILKALTGEENASDIISEANRAQNRAALDFIETRQKEGKATKKAQEADELGHEEEAQAADKEAHMLYEETLDYENKDFDYYYKKAREEYKQRLIDNSVGLFATAVQTTNLVGDMRRVSGIDQAEMIKDVEKMIENDATAIALAASGATKIFSETKGGKTIGTHANMSDEAFKKLQSLQEKYPFLVITDGRVGIEMNGVKFIPYDWLENYSENEMIKFFTENSAFESLLQSEEFAKTKVMDKILKHMKKFTKNKDLSQKDALIQFLLNTKAYASFLFSKEGREQMSKKEIRQIIFALPMILSEYLEKNGYLKKENGEENRKAVNMAKELLKNIKKAWREPTLLAVLKYGYTMQECGADEILSKEDIELVNAYKARERMFGVVGTGKDTKREGNPIAKLTKKIIADCDARTKELLDKRDDPNLSDRERLIIQVLLKCADPADPAPIDPLAFSVETVSGDEKTIYEKVNHCNEAISEYKKAHGVTPEEEFKAALKKSSAKEVLAGIESDTPTGAAAEINEIIENFNSLLGEGYECYIVSLEDGGMLGIRATSESETESVSFKEATKRPDILNAVAVYFKPIFGTVYRMMYGDTRVTNAKKTRVLAFIAQRAMVSRDSGQLGIYYETGTNNLVLENKAYSATTQEYKSEYAADYNAADRNQNIADDLADEYGERVNASIKAYAEKFAKDYGFTVGEVLTVIADGDFSTISDKQAEAFTSALKNMKAKYEGKGAVGRYIARKYEDMLKSSEERLEEAEEEYRSEYAIEVETLLESGVFNSKQKKFIRDSFNPDASMRDRLVARAMLDFVDASITEAVTKGKFDGDLSYIAEIRSLVEEYSASGADTEEVIAKINAAYSRLASSANANSNFAAFKKGLYKYDGKVTAKNIGEAMEAVESYASFIDAIQPEHWSQPVLIVPVEGAVSQVAGESDETIDDLKNALAEAQRKADAKAVELRAKKLFGDTSKRSLTLAKESIINDHLKREGFDRYVAVTAKNGEIKVFRPVSADKFLNPNYTAADILREVKENGKTFRLSEVLNEQVVAWVGKDVCDKWDIGLYTFGNGTKGATLTSAANPNAGSIVLDPKAGDANTLVHELNHFIQQYAQVDGGTSQRWLTRTSLGVETMKKVYNEYNDLLEFFCGLVYKDKFDSLTDQQKTTALSFVTYYVTQGEMWARTFEGNDVTSGVRIESSTTSEHRLPPEEIVKNGGYNKTEESAIKNGMKQDATLREKLEAKLLLTIGDEFIMMDIEKGRLPASLLELVADPELVVPVDKSVYAKQLAEIPAGASADVKRDALQKKLGDDYLVLINNNGEITVMQTESMKKWLLGSVLDANGFRNKIIGSTLMERAQPRRLWQFLTEEARKKLPHNVLDIKVKFVTDKGKITTTNGVGDYVDGTIRVSDGADIVDVFVHELNHAIQRAFDIQSGGAPSEFLNPENRGAIVEVLENYRISLWYFLKKRYVLKEETKGIFDKAIDSLLKSGAPYSDDDKKLPRAQQLVYETAAKCAYLLKTGEMLARQHEGNMLTGGNAVADSSNGRTDPGATITNSITSHKESIAAEQRNKDARTFSELLKARVAMDLGGYSVDKKRYKDTAHSSLSKKTGRAVIKPMLRDDIDIVTANTVTLNDIIKDPKKYLSQTVLDAIGSDLSEGAVYNRLREYIESKNAGISIDRDSGTHHYLLVDDNAFDDLLLDGIKKKEYTGDDLPKKNRTLKDIFGVGTLKKLNLPNIEIVVGNDLRGTETVVNEEHPQGIIYIRTTADMTNAKYIDLVSHELRHILQHYNGFETGFTPQFEVTDEMRAQFHKHLPWLFDDAELRAYAEQGASRHGQNWEDYLIQQYVYLNVGGEANAHAIRIDMMSTKPWYVTREFGGFTIFSEWYDGKDGAFRTKFVANRKADDTEYVGRGKKYVPKSETGKVLDSILSDELSPTEKSSVTLEQIIADPYKYIKKSELKSGTTKKNAYGAVRNLVEDMSGGGYTVERNAKGSEAYNQHGEYSLVQRTAQFEKVKKLKKQISDAVGGQKIASDGRKYVGQNASGNLKGYVGKRVGLAFYEFLEKTNSMKLPKELSIAIKTGVLTEKNLIGWFAESILSDGSDISNDLFAVINDCFFENPVIKTVEDLKYLSDIEQIAIMSALSRVATRRSSLQQEKIAKMSPKEFQDTIKEESKEAEEFHGYLTTFNHVSVNGESVYMEINPDYKKAAIVAIMATYDGTMATAGYAGSVIRSAQAKEEWRKLGKTVSLENSKKQGSAIHYGEGEAETRVKAYSEKKVKEARQYLVDREVTRAIAEDGDEWTPERIEIFRRAISENGKDELQAIMKARINAENSQNGLEGVDADRAFVGSRLLNQDSPIYQRVKDAADSVERLSDEEVVDAYIVAVAEDAANVDVELQAPVKKQTVSQLQASIKQKETRIQNMLLSGEIKFDELPDDIKGMFQITKGKTNGGKGRQITNYALKPEYLYVGRGRVAQTEGGIKDSGAMSHDTSKLEEVKTTLSVGLVKIKETINQKKANEAEMMRKAEETQRLSEENARLSEENKAARTKSKRLESENAGLRYQLEIQERQSSEGNRSGSTTTFTVASKTEAPQKLQQILGTSVDRFADTKVQFASRDENTGELYEVKKVKDPKTGETHLVYPENFQSRTQHEVNNADAFFEANAETLRSMTAEDAREIVAFFKEGYAVVGDNQNKMWAFEIFTLAYIISEARSYNSRWNMDEGEIEEIEALFEQKASAAGSALNAVKQMLAVLNPVTKVEQEKWEEWGVTKDELKAYTDAMNESAHAATPRESAEAYKRANEIAKGWEKRIDEQNKAKLKGKGSAKERLKMRLEALRSFRILAMLSSPVTFMRNNISNAGIFAANNAGDVISKFIFQAGKGKYEQRGDWNIAGTRASEEAKRFVRDVILVAFGEPTKRGRRFSEDMIEVQKARLRIGQDKMGVMMLESLRNKFAIGKTQWNTKVMQFFEEKISQAMSDRLFINHAVNKYLTKILTIEAARGNIDLSGGITPQIMDLFTESVLLANADYMHKTSPLKAALDELAKKHSDLAPVIQFLSPFLNSGANWFSELLTYTPVGMVRCIKDLVFMEKKMAQLDAARANGEMVISSKAYRYLATRQFGKAIVGVLLQIVGFALGAIGLIRMDDDDEKPLVKVGNISVDISKIYAANGILIGARFGQLVTHHKDGDTLWKAIETSSGIMMDGFILDDMWRNNFQYNDSWADIVANSFESSVKSFVPQFWQLVARCFKTYKVSRSSMNMVQRIADSFVIGQPFGEKQVDPYTGEYKEQGLVPTILSTGILGGTKVTLNEVSNGEIEARDCGLNLNQLSGKITIDGEEVKLKDSIAMNRLYGKLNKASIQSAKTKSHTVQTKSGTYQNLPWSKLTDEQKKSVLSGLVRKNANYAKVYEWTKEGHKYYCSKEMKQALATLGITKNVFVGNEGYVK